MTFALIASNAHLFRHPRVVQVSQTSHLLREQLLRRCHVRSVPVLNLSHDIALPSVDREQRLHQPVSNVTFIDSAEAACYALKALTEAAERGKYVAWHVQKWPSASSSDPGHKETKNATGTRVRNEVTFSAFAGDDVDFGNGPHLFVRGTDAQSRYLHQFKRYFELGDNQYIWYDFSSSLNALSTFGIRPRGFHRDVQTMAYMTPFAGEKNLTKTRTPIDLHTLAKAMSPPLLPPPKAKFITSASHYNDGEIDASLIQRACYEAALLHTVHDELCRHMEQTPVSQMSIPNEYKTDIATTLDSYDHFFRLVQEALYDVERCGVRVDSSTLTDLEERLRNEKADLEKAFQDWAVRHCPDAKYMNPLNPTQLRQLLFAPCENKVDSSRNLPASKKFRSQTAVPVDEPPPSTCSEENDTTKKKRKTKKPKSFRKQFELTGMGIMPHMFMKNGWPSTSNVALREVVSRNTHNHEGTEEQEAFTNAIENLISANERKLGASKVAKYANMLNSVPDRLQLRHFYGVEGIGVSQSRSDIYEQQTKTKLKFGDEVRQAIAPSDGNKLVVLKYSRLRLWALAQLSECAALRQRVENQMDITVTGAMRLYTGMADMMGSDSCAICDEDMQNLKENYPETLDLTKKTDSAFKYGGGVGGLRRMRRITGLKGAKVREMRERWYSGHPGVEQWHTTWRENALHQGFVGTMMGRVHGLKLRGNFTDAKTETALTNAMDFVLGGTAGEGVMAGVTRLAMNEKLRGLGWRVVLVDGNIVVLEGPEFSVDSAVPLIQLSATKPFDLECLEQWVSMPVDHHVTAKYLFEQS